MFPLQRWASQMVRKSENAYSRTPQSCTDPGRDIVEQVAAKGRTSGEFHGQRREGMNSTKKTARIAGVLYLVNGVTGFFSIIYVPSKLFVSGNAAATAHNNLAS